LSTAHVKRRSWRLDDGKLTPAPYQLSARPARPPLPPAVTGSRTEPTSAPKVLYRASSPKRKVSTLVSSEELARFQSLYVATLKGNMTALRKKDKKAAAKKKAAAEGAAAKKA
jgi:hypothetical protein